MRRVEWVVHRAVLVGAEAEERAKVERVKVEHPEVRVLRRRRILRHPPARRIPRRLAGVLTNQASSEGC